MMKQNSSMYKCIRNKIQILNAYLPTNPLSQVNKTTTSLDSAPGAT